MLQVAAPGGRTIEPAILTGLSLLRYPAFRACPSAAAVRDRIGADQPDLLAADVNLMLTQHRDGDLLVGDTHTYADTPEPFQDEALDRLLLDQTARLLGVPGLDVRWRWRGIYAWAEREEFLIAEPAPRVRAVAVTTGIGMTTALGLAPAVLDDLLA